MHSQKKELDPLSVRPAAHSADKRETAASAGQIRLLPAVKERAKGAEALINAPHSRPGSGEYAVFPGIRLMYTDERRQLCTGGAEGSENRIEINYCREGRMECLFSGGEYLYLSEGDLSIRAGSASCHTASFPLGYYQGISIVIDMVKAPRCLSCVLEDVYIDFEKLLRALGNRGNLLVLRKVPRFEHIFSELYSVPDHIRCGYFKIKVLEILYFLCGIDLDRKGTAKKRFPGSQVDAVKALKEYMDAHLGERLTLQDLSAKFSIPLTAMKSCFSAVFGVPVYTYLRSYRMQQAAVLLKETNDTVLSIAERVGYDNPSKFASAFRAVMGKSPGEYRREKAYREA